MKFSSKSDVNVDSISFRMEKKRLNRAWTPTKVVPAFEYNAPEKGHDGFLPPPPVTPDAVPSWNEFTQSTTIHGVKYIFDPRSHSLVRRVFWVLMCLTVLTYFAQQVTTSVLRYYAYNTVTDIQVNYVPSVQFPAVTLCNQNNFRTTATAKTGLYDYIDDIYSANDNFNPDDHNWEGVNATKFVNETAHQLEDFIDSCHWKGKECNLTADFERIFTGIGVCYTFNGETPHKYSNKPGSRSGLSLVLNVEQYEYMRGPNNDAGVKVSLHDPSLTPEMTDQGFVVAPGTHTLVAVHRKQVTSLPPPYGTCTENAPPYHTCVANCRNTKAANMCNCRDVYMADLTDAPENYCDMNGTFVCLRNAFEALEDQENDCNCSITCDRTQYEPGLSYAELSEFNIDQVALTTSAKKEAVREKFEAAIETQQRVVESVRSTDEALMQTFLKLADDLYEAMNSTLVLASDTNLLCARYKFPNILDDDDDSPSQDIEATRKRAEDIDDTEDGMKISFWESREQLERIVRNLLGYDRTDFVALQKLQYCMANGLDGSEDSQMVCNPPPPTPPTITCDDSVKKYCFLSSLQSLPVDTYDGGNNIKATETITQELERLDGYTDTVEWAFAGESLNPDKFADHYNCTGELGKYQNQVLVDYKSVINAISSLENVDNLTQARDIFIAIDDAVTTKLAPYLLDYDPMIGWKVRARPGDESEEKIYDSKELKCYWYLDLLDTELDDFTDFLGTAFTYMKGYHSSVRIEFKEIVKQLSRLIEHYNDDLSGSVSAVQKFLNGDITKKNVSEYFTDANLVRSISEISTKKTELLSIMGDLEDEYLEMGNSMEVIYRKTFEKTFPFIFDSTKDDYPFLQKLMNWYNDMGGKALVAEYLQLGGKLKTSDFEITPNSNISENNIWLVAKESIEGLRETDMTEETCLGAFITDMTKNIAEQITKLSNQYDLLISSMEEYSAMIKMDTSFYKKNFLQLDIFYKELSYEVITQEEAFKFESLLGEVGGFLGLLVGASILTVCELIDYIVLRCSSRCGRSKKTDVSEFGSQAQLSPNNMVERGPQHYSTTTHK